MFDPGTATAVAFSRKVRDRTLTFDPAGTDRHGRPLILDKQTKTVWDGPLGAGLRGEYNGEELKQLPATPWLIERWRVFYPDGEIHR